MALFMRFLWQPPSHDVAAVCTGGCMTLLSVGGGGLARRHKLHGATGGLLAEFGQAVSPSTVPHVASQESSIHLGCIPLAVSQPLRA